MQPDDPWPAVDPHDLPRTPEGHVDFGELLEGLTLEDLDRDGLLSVSELEERLRSAIRPVDKCRGGRRPG